MSDILVYISLFFVGSTVFYYLRNDIARRKLRKAEVTIIDLQFELNSVKWKLEMKETRGKAIEEANSNPNAIRDRMHEQGWFDNRGTKN